MPFTHENYPEPVAYRGGCKVCWRTYDDPEAALVAQEVARFLARRLETEGYDWGYCNPGEIKDNADGTYTVCCP